MVPPEDDFEGPGDAARVLQIAAGSNHTCALFADRTIKCWGASGLGQLGFDSDETCERWVPTRHGGPVATYEPCVRSPTRVPGITDAIQIAAGADHTCALLADHTVKCWGGNFLGTLGDGTTVSRSTPRPVLGLGGVVEIVAGLHDCARLGDGTVKCWGPDGWGELGFPAPDLCAGSKCAKAPRAVIGLTGVRQIAVGGSSTCALLVDATVKCWGENGAGQLGFPSTELLFGLYPFTSEPTTVPGLTGVSRIAVGESFTCAARVDGAVQCWGNDATGQLGFPFERCASSSPTCVMTPTTVSGITHVVDVAADGGHVCARRSDGTMACWGSNSAGQLGFESDSICVGGTLACGTPHLVPGETDVAGIAVGGERTCARRSDGTFRCWGSNCFGQLGDGTATACGRP